VRAVIVACLGGFFAIVANTLSFMMIGKINERVPKGDRISYFWWGTEVRRRFKALYPQSRLVTLLDSCVILMTLCFAFSIRFWVFGSSGPGK
jgi:hypothetical protein